MPPNKSATGKRQNLYFDTKSLADIESQSIARRHSTFGQLLNEISPHDVSEAVRALELLRPLNVGLLEAVTRYVDDHNRRSESKTFREAFDAYEKLRDDRTYDYRKEIEHTRVSVAHLLDLPVIDVQASALESALAGYSQSTRDARIRRLRSVFNEAVRQGWLTSNPADRMNMKVRRRDEVRIYAVADVQSLLDRALSDEPVLVPFLAICAFCGLRPENEAFNLLWSDVHIDDQKPQIVIRPETSKTRRRRFVDISANCIAWIRASGVENQGRVLPFSASTLKRRRIQLCATDEARGRSAIEWIQDGLRHTFCSAHLAHHESVDRLLIQTGHTDPQVLWQHYYRVMRKEDAEDYWSLLPLN